MLREAGRRETVAGGRVVDAHPPSRARSDATARLRALDDAAPEEVPRVLLEWGRILPAAELLFAAGALPDAGAVPVGAWLVSESAAEEGQHTVTGALAAHHAEHPLRPGMELADLRGTLARHHAAFRDTALADAFVTHLAAGGVVIREASAVRLPTHRVSTTGSEDADRLVSAVSADETAPPTVRELTAAGYDLELIGAVSSEGRLVRIAADLVMTPAIVERALELIRAAVGVPRRQGPYAPGG